MPFRYDLSMTSPTTMMDARGTLTLPAEAQEALGLQDGARFIVTVEDGRLLLQPLLASSLEELRGIFASDRDLVAELQEERRQDKMVTYTLDASALLRFLLNQAGALRVQQILELGQSGQARVCISAVNWGEVVGRVDGEHGRAFSQALGGTLVHYRLEIVDVDAKRAQRTALLKKDYGLGYADAFCVELLMSHPESVLLTADYDFKKFAHLVPTEFLAADAPSPENGPVQ